jgi:AcrR family transcriptional regulator
LARPKSQDKRKAIIDSAVRVFARSGLSAPTSSISKAAGVAEGTLFTYFPTKEALLNEVYSDIKKDLSAVVFASFPEEKGVLERMRHVWDRYAEWGAHNPDAYKVIKEIELWEGLSDAARSSDLQTAKRMTDLSRSARKEGLIRSEFSDEYLAGAIIALSEMTVGLMRRDPAHASKYRVAGFALLLNGVRSS